MEKHARYRQQNAWANNERDRINFLMPKGTKQRIKEAAGKLGITASEFVRQAIEEKLSK